ncbi:MAG: response regulator, partial [Micromonosporaceae bacterium]
KLPFHGEKVLIIDDDQRNVYALRTLLERHGLQVVNAENAEAGLQTLMRARDIDLVLMDIMMPGLDGHGAIAKIREDERYPDLPIIAVTAKAMKGDRERSLASGANDHVTKPVDIHQLSRLISRHLPEFPGGRPPLNP